MKLINIGFGNMVSANRLVAIVSPESAPIKRIIQDARERGTLIDATYGRRTRAVIITDSDHVVLSAVQPETVANRLSDEEDEEFEGNEYKRTFACVFRPIRRWERNRSQRISGQTPPYGFFCFGNDQKAPGRGNPRPALLFSEPGGV